MPPPNILEYRRPEAPHGKPVELALIPYAVGYAAGGATTSTVAVFSLGQWNSYIGPIPSLLIDGLLCLGATLAAATMVAVCGTGLRRLTRTHRPWRSSRTRAIVGLVCGLATFCPTVIDVYFTGIYDVAGGRDVGRGWGTAIGWASFIAGPMLASMVLLENTEAPHP
jgi:hypothetical protein